MILAVAIFVFVVPTLIALAIYFKAPWIVMVDGLFVILAPLSYPMFFSPEDSNYGMGLGIYFATIFLGMLGLVIGITLIFAGAFWQLWVSKRAADKKPVDRQGF